MKRLQFFFPHNTSLSECLHCLNSVYWHFTYVCLSYSLFTIPETSQPLQQLGFWIIVYWYCSMQLYFMNELREYFVSNCTTVWGLEESHQLTPFWPTLWTKVIQVCKSPVVKLNSLLLLKGFYSKKCGCVLYSLGRLSRYCWRSCQISTYLLRNPEFHRINILRFWTHKEQQLLDAESLPACKPQCRWVCSLFLCLSAAKNWLWRQIMGTLFLLAFILEFC